MPGPFDDLTADLDAPPQADSAPAPDGAGYATVFGLNTDGSIDQEDNGQGHWGANTRDRSLAGVSLPRSVLRQQFGDEENANGKMVEVTNPATGKKAVLPIVDIGPGETTGNALDLTYAANRALGGSGKTPMQYRFAGATPTATPTPKAGPFDDLTSDLGDAKSDPFSDLTSDLGKPAPQPEPPELPAGTGDIAAPSMGLNLAPNASLSNPVPSFRVPPNSGVAAEDMAPSLRDLAYLHPGNLETGLTNVNRAADMPAAQKGELAIQQAQALGRVSPEQATALAEQNQENIPQIGGVPQSLAGMADTPLLPRLEGVDAMGVPSLTYEKQTKPPATTGEAVMNAANNLVQSLSTPKNLAIAAALPGAGSAIQKAASAYFGVTMTKDAAEKLGEASTMPPGPERKQAIIEAVATGGLGILSAAHLGGESMPEKVASPGQTPQDIASKLGVSYNGSGEGLHAFTDPDTGSTFHVPEQQLTPETVASKLESIREPFRKEGNVQFGDATDGDVDEAIRKAQEPAMADAMPAPKAAPNYEEESKRVWRGETGQTKPVDPTPEERQAIIDSYQEQVQKTGFPAVKIADVMEGAGLPLNDRSRGLIMGMGAAGDIASLPTGDWSASTERQRAWGVRPADADNVANGGHVGLMMKLKPELRTAPPAVDALSLGEIAAKPKEIAKDVESTVSPSTVDKPAEEMGLGLRGRGGELARRDQSLAAQWEPARRMFQKMPESDQLDFIKRMEEGRSQVSPTLQTIADQIRSELDKRVGDVQALGTGKLRQVIQNYFPHIWDIPDKNAGNIFQRIFGKRPIEGSKSFLKKRSIPTVEQGIAAGLKLKTTNPVEQALLKAHEMDKYITTHRMIEAAKKSGLIKQLKIGEKEEGYKRLEGPEAEIKGPPTVKVQETVDKGVYDGLNRVAKGLGIDTERVMVPKGPGSPRGALGLSFQGQDRVQTRFATPLSVLAHEIGHQIQDKFNFLDKLRKTVPNADLELGNIAGLTGRGQGAFTDPELAAQTLEAYIHAPETMEAVAPGVYRAFDDFLKSDPKLAPLRDIKPGLELQNLTGQVPHGGMLVMGHLHAPEAAARVYNNFQSQGFAGRPAYDAVKFAADHLNALQLALSGFHLTGVSINSVLSKVGGGLTDLFTGHPIKAAAKLVSAPIAPITDAFRGGKILKEYMNPGSTDARTARDVQNIVQGGGRARTEGVHKFGAFQSMMDAFRKGETLSTAWHAPMAALQAPLAWIHNEFIPRIKLAVAAREASDDLARLPAGATEMERNRVRSQAWDNVDDRFGQMTYDNLFWHKTLKDMLQIGTRSVGWNLGTLRAGLGAAKDVVTAPGRLMRGEQAFTQRMGYAAALPMGVAMLGAVYQYAHTGKGPQELKDYFYPRTGKTLPDGTPERIVLPTYMKDVASYSKHPVQTAVNKLNPIWSTLAQMVQNKDYYGTQIRNPNDPAVKQLQEEGHYLENTVLPFSVTAQSHRQGNDLETKAESLMGLQPPPAENIRSKAAQEIADWHALHGQSGQTQEEFDKMQARHAITTAVRQRGDVSTAVHEGRLQGLTEPQIQTALKAAQQNPIAGGFKALPIEEMQRILPMATPQERQVWAPILAQKLARARK